MADEMRAFNVGGVFVFALGVHGFRPTVIRRSVIKIDALLVGCIHGRHCNIVVNVDVEIYS